MTRDISRTDIKCNWFGRSPWSSVKWCIVSSMYSFHPQVTLPGSAGGIWSWQTLPKALWSFNKNGRGEKGSQEPCELQNLPITPNLISCWWLVSNVFFIFTPTNWGRWTHFEIFQRDWFNHQLVTSHWWSMPFPDDSLVPSPVGPKNFFRDEHLIPKDWAKCLGGLSRVGKSWKIMNDATSSVKKFFVGAAWTWMIPWEHLKRYWNWNRVCCFFCEEWS